MDEARVRRPRWVPLAVGALAIALLLTSATSAAAAQRERIGDRISLFDPPSAYPADTAFHLWHGFVFELANGDRAVGRSEFHLDLDGAPVAADFVDVDVLEARAVSRVWVFNFPDGLSGIHTFTGHWITRDGEDTIEVTIDFTS